MQRRYITVDVFTDRAFGGNPLAVLLDAQGLSTAQMQAIAREFNYSETTFVLQPREIGHDAEVRIFTVRSEIPFAGHPNVGTAFALAGRGSVYGHAVGRLLVFEADNALIIHDMDPPDVFPYKSATVRRLFAAFQAMLSKAAGI